MKDYNNELYHYGVKGMKWGVRKKRVSIGNDRSRDHSNIEDRQSQRNDIRKKIAIGVGITVGVLAAGYGAYKLNDAVHYIKINKKAISLVDDALKKANAKNLQYAKDDYSAPFYKNNFTSNKLESMINAAYKRRSEESAKQALKDKPKLVKAGYKYYKDQQKDKIRDFFNPSIFGSIIKDDPLEIYKKYGLGSI